MTQQNDKKTPSPRMNEQDLREQVRNSPANEDNRTQADRDGEQNRKDEAEGSRHTRDKGHNAAAAEGRINTNQSRNIDTEAQNVNDADGRPLTDDEASRAVNKATEGIRQGRDEGTANSNAEKMNQRKGR
ncbi:MAG TPA: hypothetical protein VEY32_03340 [Flavisolibacter sp.]|nr:hypothetical protein [Flavisolibacter sp.]